jgi:hypothetical protein
MRGLPPFVAIGYSHLDRYDLSRVCEYVKTIGNHLPNRLQPGRIERLPDWQINSVVVILLKHA